VTGVVALLAFTACWMTTGGGRGARVGRLLVGRSRPRTAPIPEGPLARAVTCVVGGGVVGLAFGGPVSMLVGAVAGAGASVAIGRLEPAAVRRDREWVTAQLPLALDLLAACTAAGRSVDGSLTAVADAMGGPLAAPFRVVAHRLVLGDDPATGWASMVERPELARLGRTMARAMVSGAPVTSTLLRLAEDQRRDRRWANERRARSVGVRAAGPLAVCFLPAFLVVGVIPTVVGAVGKIGV
jgi:Flp pilus assembly protein TadB